MSTAAPASNDPHDWSLAAALALRAKVEKGEATPEDQEMWRRLRNRFQAKYRRGSLSERSARQLGII